MSRSLEDVIIVGVCASGKSTLAAKLKAAGLRACTVAQEHSCIPDLWSRPGAANTIYLHASFEAVKRRRHSFMHFQNYQAQLHRLRTARALASVRVDTSELTPDEVFLLVQAQLRSQDPEREGDEKSGETTDRADERRQEPLPVPEEPGDRTSSRRYEGLPIPDEL